MGPIIVKNPQTREKELVIKPKIEEYLNTDLHQLIDEKPEIEQRLRSTSMDGNDMKDTFLIIKENLGILKQAKLNRKPNYKENENQPSTKPQKNFERRSHSVNEGDLTFYRDQLLKGGVASSSKGNNLKALHEIEEVPHESFVGSQISANDNNNK